DRSADGSVAELGKRSGGDTFAQADGNAQEHPADTAREHLANSAQRGGAQKHVYEIIIHLLPEQDAAGAAESAQYHAERAGTAEADERLVAKRFDADDEIANEAADECAAQQELGRAGGILLAEDAKEHPTEKSAQAAEYGVEIDPYQ